MSNRTSEVIFHFIFIIFAPAIVRSEDPSASCAPFAVTAVAIALSTIITSKAVAPAALKRIT